MITVKICFNCWIILKQTKLKHLSILPYLPSTMLYTHRTNIWRYLAASNVTDDMRKLCIVFDCFITSRNWLNRTREARLPTWWLHPNQIILFFVEMNHEILIQLLLMFLSHGNFDRVRWPSTFKIFKFQKLFIKSTDFFFLNHCLEMWVVY